METVLSSSVSFTSRATAFQWQALKFKCCQLFRSLTYKHAYIQVMPAINLIDQVCSKDLQCFELLKYFSYPEIGASYRKISSVAKVLT